MGGLVCDFVHDDREDAITQLSSRIVSPSPPSGSTLSRRQLHLLTGGLMVGLLLAELDQTVFATALPTIAGDLHGVGSMVWVTTAYVLAGTIAMPVCGKLGDLAGRRAVFLTALAVLVLGSVVGGLAPDMPWLIAGRAIQGLGGGGLLVLIQAIVADVIPARERAPYLATIGAVFALAAVLGPVLGGWLADGVGWRWALWLNVPLGLAAIGIAAALLRTLPVRPTPVRADVGGIATLSLTVTALVLVATWAGSRYAWTSPVTLGLLATALAAGGAFLLIEARTAEPLLPLTLFTERNFVIPALAGLVMAVAVFGTVNYLPTYLQMAAGLSPTASGLMLITLMTGIGLATVGAAQLVKRTGRYRGLPILGCAAVALALFGLSRLSVASGLPAVGGWLLLFGLGMGCALEILVLVVQNAVRPDQLGAATGGYNFLREVGVTLGTAIVGSLFTTGLTARLSQIRTDAVVDPSGLSPAALGQLPEPDQVVVMAAYHDSLVPIFGLVAPILVLSAIALVFVRPVPLATRVPSP